MGVPAEPDAGERTPDDDAPDDGTPWAGLAAALRASGETGRAESALVEALRSGAPGPAVRQLAASVAAAGGWPGWCGLDVAGRLHLGGDPNSVLLDGEPVAAEAPLPAGWQRARSLAVSRDGRAFLGSPLRPDRIARVEGVVWATPEGGVEGWAWHPGDPAASPRLRVVAAGARWTVTASEPGSALPGQPFARPRRMAHAEPALFGALVERLTEATVDYLALQAEAGAEALMLFDSWAGLLPPPLFAEHVTEPARRIRAALRERCPGVPVIGFPRLAGIGAVPYAEASGVDAVALDTGADLARLAPMLPPGVATQGNLDPMALVAGGAAFARCGVSTELAVRFFNKTSTFALPNTSLANALAFLFERFITGT